jgi:glutamine synthetase
VLAGNAYRDSTPTIPLSWPEALTVFERSDFARDCLGERFARLYAQTRRGEMQDFSSYVSALEYAWYLTTT